MKRNALLACLLICSPLTAEYDYTRALLYLTSAVGISGFVYTWLGKQAVQHELTEHKKRFKHQEFISDRYEAAFDALVNYKDYALMVEEGLDDEQIEQAVSDALCKQFAHDAHLLNTFLEQVIVRRQQLEFKLKEVDKLFTDWSHNRKRILLSLQGPHIIGTFELMITTLTILENQIPYVQAALFVDQMKDTLAEETKLYQNNSKVSVSSHIITSSSAGEQYPYRAYSKIIDSYFSQVQAIKAKLDKKELLPFQKNTAQRLNTLYNVLEFMNKEVKASKAYTAECTKYEAEKVAHAKEKENQALKKQILELKKQLDAYKTVEPANN